MLHEHKTLYNNYPTYSKYIEKMFASIKLKYSSLHIYVKSASCANFVNAFQYHKR